MLKVILKRVLKDDFEHTARTEIYRQRVFLLLTRGGFNFFEVG